jgi:hypothetical protein
MENVDLVIAANFKSKTHLLRVTILFLAIQSATVQV